MTLEDFNELILVSGEEGVQLLADKFLIQGLPSIFNGSNEKYFDFKKRIADEFNIGTHEIFIVGSAKLGFSYRKGTIFHDGSDIDVAIVDESLFAQYALIVREYIYDMRGKLFSHTEEQDKNFHYFTKCMALGFIRPDSFLDILSRVVPKPEWEKFFKSISSGRSEVGDHDVKGIIYRSYDDLRRYHISGLHSKLNVLKVEQYAK